MITSCRMSRMVWSRVASFSLTSFDKRSMASSASWMFCRVAFILEWERLSPTSSLPPSTYSRKVLFKRAKLLASFARKSIKPGSSPLFSS